MAGNVKWEDPLTSQQRSALMAKVRSTGNKSTEGRVEVVLTQLGVGGWVKHAKGVPGTPDFYFRDCGLALFVHGCFWHGCQICDRNVPRTRTRFWKHKIEDNRRRDRRVRRTLWRQGYHVIRVWEHDLAGFGWIRRLQSMRRRLGCD